MLFLLERMKPDHSGLIASSESLLPAAPGHTICIREAADIDTDHGFAQVAAHLNQNGRIIVMGGGLHNGGGTLGRIAALEDTAAYKHPINAKLHHQGCVC